MQYLTSITETIGALLSRTDSAGLAKKSDETLLFTEEEVEDVISIPEQSDEEANLAMVNDMTSYVELLLGREIKYESDLWCGLIRTFRGDLGLPVWWVHSSHPLIPHFQAYERSNPKSKYIEEVESERGGILFLYSQDSIEFYLDGVAIQFKNFGKALERTDQKVLILTLQENLPNTEYIV